MDQVNYPIVTIVVIAVIILLVWIIRRNQKDEKSWNRISSNPN
ncbi:hypothetical protein ACRQ5D_07460 [Mucilaginibacter sp. P25]